MLPTFHAAHQSTADIDCRRTTTNLNLKLERLVTLSKQVTPFLHQTPRQNVCPKPIW